MSDEIISRPLTITALCECCGEMKNGMCFVRVTVARNPAPEPPVWKDEHWCCDCSDAHDIIVEGRTDAR